MQAHSRQRRNARRARSSFTTPDNPHMSNSRSTNGSNVASGPSQIQRSTHHSPRNWTNTAQDISHRKLPLANGLTESNVNLRTFEQFNGIRSDQRPIRYRQQTKESRVRERRNDTGSTFADLHSPDQRLNAPDGGNNKPSASQSSRDKLDRAHQATETFIAQLPSGLLPSQLRGDSADAAKAFLTQFASSILKDNSAPGEQYEGNEDAEALWVSDEGKGFRPSGTSRRDKSSISREVDQQTTQRTVSTKQKQSERRLGSSAINDDAGRNHGTKDDLSRPQVALDSDSEPRARFDDSTLRVSNAVYQIHGLGASQTTDHAMPRRQRERELRQYPLHSSPASSRMPSQGKHANSRKSLLLPRDPTEVSLEIISG